eukprot:763129-Hanusia_phi.AAC.4
MQPPTCHPFSPQDIIVDQIDLFVSAAIRSISLNASQLRISTCMPAQKVSLSMHLSLSASGSTDLGKKRSAALGKSSLSTTTLQSPLNRNAHTFNALTMREVCDEKTEDDRGCMCEEEEKCGRREERGNKTNLDRPEIGKIAANKMLFV